jgi:hypothetical protein
MAARALYVRALDQLRSNETWCDKNEEKAFIWTDETTGKVMEKVNLVLFTPILRVSVIGKRLAISALLSNSDFHLPPSDIFEYDKNHSVDSNHFVAWIDRTSHTIRKELGKTNHIVYLPHSLHPFLGKDATVTVILDNATWHNRLTEETMLPKRS